MTKYQEIHQAIFSAKHLVITAHKSPDGDSIGSSMALYQFLKKEGKSVTICHPDPFPNFLAWVPNVEEILNFENQETQIREKFEQADLIFALDYNHPSRLGDEMSKLMEGRKKDIVMIDHHLNPDDFANVSVSEPEACSTCQLVYELIVAKSLNNLDATIGTPLYLGIMTDTGSFRFNSVTPRTHEILAQLLSLGVNHTDIHEAVFGQNSLNQLRLRSYAICNKLEIIEDGKVAIMCLSSKELDEYNYEKGDTEGLVNVALGVTGVQLAVYAQERDGKVKLSFRSKGNQAVNQLAGDHFDGGGHAMASGGISHIPLAETVEKIKKVVQSYLV